MLDLPYIVQLFEEFESYREMFHEWESSKRTSTMNDFVEKMNEEGGSSSASFEEQRDTVDSKIRAEIEQKMGEWTEGTTSEEKTKVCRKVYYSVSLKCHPDKRRRGDDGAAADFLQRAKGYYNKNILSGLVSVAVRARAGLPEFSSYIEDEINKECRSVTQKITAWKDLMGGGGEL